jgi:Anti-CBASS Acb1-like protein
MGNEVKFRRQYASYRNCPTSCTAATDAYIKRMSLVNAAKSMTNAVLLDKEEESETQVTFSGMPEVLMALMAYMQMAAGAADIPVTHLLGRAPGRAQRHWRERPHLLRVNAAMADGRGAEGQDRQDQGRSHQDLRRHQHRAVRGAGWPRPGCGAMARPMRKSDARSATASTLWSGG